MELSALQMWAPSYTGDAGHQLEGVSIWFDRRWLDKRKPESDTQTQIGSQNAARRDHFAAITRSTTKGNRSSSNSNKRQQRRRYTVQGKGGRSEKGKTISLHRSRCRVKPVLYVPLKAGCHNGTCATKASD